MSFRERKDSEVFVTEAFKEEKKSRQNWLILQLKEKSHSGGSSCTVPIGLGTFQELKRRKKFEEELEAQEEMDQRNAAPWQISAPGWSLKDVPILDWLMLVLCYLTFGWSCVTESCCPRCDASNPVCNIFHWKRLSSLHQGSLQRK